jgi:hypothetical protein
VHTGFLWGNLMERDHLEGLGVDRRIMMGTGLILLRIGTGGRHVNVVMNLRVP